MKKLFWYIGVIGCILFFVTACTEHKEQEEPKNEITEKTLTYGGSNENWSASLVIDVDIITSPEGEPFFQEKRYTGRFAVTYLGELSDLEHIKSLAISYKSYAGNGESVYNFDQPPTEKTFVHPIGGGGATPREEEKIPVFVKVDGEAEESFVIQKP